MAMRRLERKAFKLAARQACKKAWGSGKSHLVTEPVVRSEFEQLVDRLRLKPEQYVESSTLRNWVIQNKDYRYVPEWLLNSLHLTVRLYGDADVSSTSIHYAIDAQRESQAA